MFQLRVTEVRLKQFPGLNMAEGSFSIPPTGLLFLLKLWYHHCRLRSYNSLPDVELAEIGTPSS